MASGTDDQMSRQHFEISWDGRRARLRDLGSRTGTSLNGKQVRDAEVQHGAWIQAGATVFSVYVEASTPPPRRDFWEDLDGEDLDEVERLRMERARAEEAQRTARAREALAVLREAWAKAPLHAILDAARDRRIITLLHESVDECGSLYDGTQGEKLDEVAPSFTAGTRAPGHRRRSPSNRRTRSAGSANGEAPDRRGRRRR